LSLLNKENNDDEKVFVLCPAYVGFVDFIHLTDPQPGGSGGWIIAA